MAGRYGFVVDVLPEHFGGAAAGLVDGQLYGGQARVQLGTEIVVVAADHLDVPSGAEAADLEPYIEDTAVMPNFNSVVLAEFPNTKAFITAPDGGIYALPGYNKEPGAYLEGPVCINAKWMETLGLEYAAFMAGEFQKARLIQFGINRIVTVLLRHGCIPAIKEALTLKGFDAGHVAYPGKRFDAEERRQLAEELRAAGYEI